MEDEEIKDLKAKIRILKTALVNASKDLEEVKTQIKEVLIETED